MPLEFETMTAGGKFSDACRFPILDLRPLMPDDVLASIPRFLFRWEDDNTMRILLDDNYSTTAASGNCDFVTFASETLECTIQIPNQKRLSAGISDVDYEQFMIEFCAAHRMTSFPTLFRADGTFDTGAEMASEFIDYILSDLRRRYMQELRRIAWYGDQANQNELHGLMTQLDAGPIQVGDACDPYQMVVFDWNTLVGGAGAASNPAATIDAASDVLTIHGMDFDGNEGLNMVEFLVLWLERLFEYDLYPWRDETVEFELWLGKGQTNCIANLAACMQPCDGCVNPLSDPLIRDRAADFRRNRRIWLYPYDNVTITLRTSPELVNEMLLIPTMIGGRPTIGWVFRDQVQQWAIINGQMPYYGAQQGTLPNASMLYPTDEVDDQMAFELRAFQIQCQKNGNCIDYWINSESALLFFGIHLWLRLQNVDCASLVPTQKHDDLGIAATGCADPGGNNLTLTVVALEDYGAVDPGDTYLVYGEDGWTTALGTVVTYTPATDALILDMGADLDCTYGGGMAAATVVKLAEN
jgi:hypothetical protein